MSRVVVINHLTLDGVMQAPGRPEEDTRGGFARGGWAGSRVDEVVNAAMGARMPQSRGLLLGRRSYEDMLGLPEHPGQPVQGRPQQRSQARRLQDAARAAALAELDAAER